MHSSLDPVHTAGTCSPGDIVKTIKVMITQVGEISCADREKLNMLLCEFSDVISVGEKDHLCRRKGPSL